MNDSIPPDLDLFEEDPDNNLVAKLSEKVVGQPTAMKYIVPYVRMYQAGLSPEGRPAGIFLLLGPTGTGKTRTVEALADILHGSEKKVLKIDCGEFQLEHEVAKLTGAPPGYLGHRETESLLTQERLRSVGSEQCDLAIVLFDEIEKAAPAVVRLLLGILDKAQLRLGDNTEVNFEKSLIFFTSNLGAREMLKEIHPELGFRSAVPPAWTELSTKLENIALAAVRKKYSPEFCNRIDAVITYQPLDEEAFRTILDQQIAELQRHVNTRLGDRCFQIEVPEESRRLLLKHGTSPEYGARELKRTIHRYLTQPLATLVIQGKIESGYGVRAELAGDGESLELRTVPGEQPAPAPHPVILIVDDNESLLRLLKEQLTLTTGWKVMTAATAAEAGKLFSNKYPDVALLDFLLPDTNGVHLGVTLKRASPKIHIIIMTGADLPAEELSICKEYRFPLVPKPFLGEHILSLIRDRLRRPSSASA